jgi:hypothetical protein
MSMVSVDTPSHDTIPLSKTLCKPVKSGQNYAKLWNYAKK